MAAVLADASHDCWTRLRQGPWSGYTRLPLALRMPFPGAGGALLRAKTGVENPDARRVGKAMWGGEQTPQSGLWRRCGAAGLDGGAAAHPDSLLGVAYRGRLQSRSGRCATALCLHSAPGSAAG
jgi:hypothetical protein